MGHSGVLGACCSALKSLPLIPPLREDHISGNKKNPISDSEYYNFPGGSDHKEFACNVGDQGSIPGSGRSSEDGHGNPLQYSYLENPMDRGAWWVTIA